MAMTDTQNALLDAAKTEKDAMDFYKFGAEKMPDDKARATFEMLAREELEHARSFYDCINSVELKPFDAFISAPPDTESNWWKALQQAMLGEFDERKALELALDQEEALEKELLATAEKMTDPDVKAVYLANARSTHRHEELIEEDYKAIYG